MNNIIFCTLSNSCYNNIIVSHLYVYIKVTTVYQGSILDIALGLCRAIIIIMILPCGAADYYSYLVQSSYSDTTLV